MVGKPGNKIALVTDIMENTIKLSIPLNIAHKIGNYWGENIISW